MTTVFPLSQYPCFLQCDCSISHQALGSTSLSLNLGWPGDLLWTVKYNRKDKAAILGLGFKRSCMPSFSLRMVPPPWQWAWAILLEDKRPLEGLARKSQQRFPWISHHPANPAADYKHVCESRRDRENYPAGLSSKADGNNHEVNEHRFW